MYCRICGASGADGKFCRICGTPVLETPQGNNQQTANNAPQVNNNPQANNNPQVNNNPQANNVPPAYYGTPVQSPGATQGNYSPYRPAPQAVPHTRRKKSRAPLVVAVIAVCLAVILGGGFLFGKLSGGLLTRFASPEKYYQSIEKKNLKTWIAHTSNYAQLTEGGTNTTLSLSVTEDGKSFMTDMDSSWLNTMSLNLDSATDEARSYSAGTFDINGTKILDFETLRESSGGATLLRLPEFSPLFAQLPADSGVSDIGLLGLSFPDMNAAGKVLDRYGEIVIDHLVKVEKSEETVTVGATSAEYDVLTVTVDSETYGNIARAVAEEARDDQELQKLIRFSAEQSGEDPDAAYSEFLQKLDEAQNSDASAENTLIATMTLYVDKKGEVCGRRYVPAEAPETARYYLTAWDGKNFETEASFPSEGGMQSLTGSGIKSGDKLSGDYVLRAGDVQIMALRVDDFDKKAAKDGKLSGSFTVMPGKDYIDESGQSPMMATLSYRVDITSGSGKLDATVSFLSDTATLGTLQIAAKAKKTEIPTPADGEAVDSETYFSSIDQEAMLETLKQSLRNAGVPEEYLN